jgi:hypothetical protein
MLTVPFDPGIYSTALGCGCLTAGGATIGCAEGRPLRGALVGLFVAIVLFMAGMVISSFGVTAARE